MKKLFIIAIIFWCSTAFGSWSAKPLSKEIVDGKLVVFVGYTDGTTVITRYHKVDTYEQFLGEVRSEVSRLDGVDAAAIKVKIGDMVDTSVVTIPPTQEELDRAAFVSLCNDYRLRLAEVKAGVGKSTQADVDSAEANIRSAYKDSYAALIVGLF